MFVDERKIILAHSFYFPGFDRLLRSSGGYIGSYQTYPAILNI